MNPRDRQLKTFLAIHGYPDPDATTQERTIWRASTGQIRNSRICSASSTRKVALTSPQIQQIVEDAYTRFLQLPDEWTPAQRQRFLDEQAAHISYLVAELGAEMGAQAVADWTKAHHSPPDYMTKVGLLNTAHAQAMEIVLNNEIYEMIPDFNDTPTDSEAPPMPPREQVPWNKRWTSPRYRTEPSEELEALVRRVWPDPRFTVGFRIKAGYLMAARIEDGLPIPDHPGHPLAGDLALMVQRDLRDDGLT